MRQAMVQTAGRQMFDGAVGDGTIGQSGNQAIRQSGNRTGNRAGSTAGSRQSKHAVSTKAQPHKRMSHEKACVCAWRQKLVVGEIDPSGRAWMRLGEVEGEAKERGVFMPRRVGEARAAEPREGAGGARAAG